MASRRTQIGIIVLACFGVIAASLVVLLHSGESGGQDPLSENDVHRLHAILGIARMPNGLNRIRVFVDRFRDDRLDIYVRMECSNDYVENLTNTSWIGVLPLSLAECGSDFDITRCLGPAWFDAGVHRQGDRIYESGVTEAHPHNVRVLVRPSASGAVLYFVTKDRNDLSPDLFSVLTRYRFQHPPVLGPDDARYTREWNLTAPSGAATSSPETHEGQMSHE